MNELKQQLLEALKHNLFITEGLRKDIVKKLPGFSDRKAQHILNLLLEANQNQDETLRSILEHEPYFFHRIEQTILHTMSEEFDRLSAEEVNQAENQLMQDIAHYQE